MRRRAFIRSALGAACLLGSAGTAWLITPPRGELLEIAVIATGDEAVDRLLIAGAQDAADQHRLRLHVHRPELGDSRNQSQLLATAAGLDPAAVVICPVSPARQHHAIASAAGRTVVVTCGRDAPDSGRMIFIGHGDFRTGRMAAQLVKRLAPGGATVCVVQERGNESHAAHLEGLRYVLETAADDHPAWRCVEVAVAPETNVAEAVHRRAAAVDGPTVIVCCSAALAAQVASDRPAGAAIVSCEADERTLELLAAGRVDAALANDWRTIGYHAVARAALLSRSGPVNRPHGGMGSAYLPKLPLTIAGATEPALSSRPRLHRAISL